MHFVPKKTLEVKFSNTSSFNPSLFPVLALSPSY